MSLIQPYYFSGSANMSMSIWMRSNDFGSAMTLSLLASATLLASSSTNGWRYDSSYPCAAIHCPTPSSSIYEVGCTSGDGAGTGNFKLYISQGETSSIDTSQPYGVSRLVYVPPSDRIFSVEWTYTTPTATKFVVINPLTNTIVQSHNYTAVLVLDAVYNSREGRVLLWVTSGSTGDHLEEYDISGSFVTSYPISINWGYHTRGGYDLSRMCYCSIHNQILLVPVATAPDITPLSYSIFDCNTNAIVHDEMMSFTYGQGVDCTYVSSSDKYYIISTNIADVALKVDPLSYVASTSAITGSTHLLKYIPELDILVGAGEWGSSTSLKIYDPATELSTSVVYGFCNADEVLYEPCRNCIAVADANDFVAQVGGICYFDTGSTFEPVNFVLTPTPYTIVYCSSTSTIWAGDEYSGIVRSIMSAVPTGSFNLNPYVYCKESDSSSFDMTLYAGSAIPQPTIDSPLMPIGMGLYSGSLVTVIIPTSSFETTGSVGYDLLGGILITTVLTSSTFEPTGSVGYDLLGGILITTVLTSSAFEPTGSVGYDLLGGILITTIVPVTEFDDMTVTGLSIGLISGSLA